GPQIPDEPGVALGALLREHGTGEHPPRGVRQPGGPAGADGEEHGHAGGDPQQQAGQVAVDRGRGDQHDDAEQGVGHGPAERGEPRGHRPAKRSVSKPSSSRGPGVPVAMRKYSTPNAIDPSLLDRAKNGPSVVICVACARSASSLAGRWSRASMRALISRSGVMNGGSGPSGSMPSKVVVSPASRSWRSPSRIRSALIAPQ